MAGPLCGAGLICKDADAMGVGTCAAPIPAGGACEPKGGLGTDECDGWNGDECDQTTKKCTNVTVPLPPIGAECVSGSCSEAAYCGSDNKCKARPREGEPCIANEVNCMTPAKCIGGVCKIRDAAVCK